MANGYVGTPPNDTAGSIVAGRVGVPTSYAQLDYIQSTGSQLIDTGLKANPTTRVVMNFYLVNYSGQDRFFGTEGDFYYHMYVNGNYYYAFSYQDTSGNWVSTGKSCSSGQTMTIDLNGYAKTLTLSGSQTYSSSLSSYTATKTSTGNLFLLASSIGSGKAKVKLYYCKIYDNDVLVRDFVPAVLDNGVVGLFDNVENKFYSSASGVNFTAGSTIGSFISLGSVARKLIKGYVGVAPTFTPIEYVETSGTQYIDTGITPNQNTGFEIDFTPYNPIASSGFGYIFGAADGSYRFSMNTYPSFSGGEFYVTHGYNPYMVQNTRKQITYKNGVFVDDEGHTYTVSATFSISKTMLLFTTSTSSSPSTYMAKMRLYNFKLYNGDTLTRDFVPATDEYGVACLYDKVQGKAYYNAGTGTFTAGNPTGESDIKQQSVARLCFLPNPYVPLHYIEGTGVQYIRTGYRPNTNTIIEMKFRLSGSSPSIDYERVIDAFSGSTADLKLQRSGTSTRWDLSVNRTGAWSGTLAQETDYVVEFTNASATVNGITSTFTAQTYTSSYEMQIWHGNDRYGKFKLYYMKIYEGNTLERDFIPVLNGNGVPCLYDRVSGSLYQNAGSGTFSYG